MCAAKPASASQTLQPKENMSANKRKNQKDSIVLEEGVRKKGRKEQGRKEQQAPLKRKNQKDAIDSIVVGEGVRKKGRKEQRDRWAETRSYITCLLRAGHLLEFLETIVVKDEDDVATKVSKCFEVEMYSCKGKPDIKGGETRKRRSYVAYIRGVYRSIETTNPTIKFCVASTTEDLVSGLGVSFQICFREFLRCSQQAYECIYPKQFRVRQSSVGRQNRHATRLEAYNLQIYSSQVDPRSYKFEKARGSATVTSNPELYPIEAAHVGNQTKIALIQQKFQDLSKHQATAVQNLQRRIQRLEVQVDTGSKFFHSYKENLFRLVTRVEQKCTQLFLFGSIEDCRSFNIVHFIYKLASDKQIGLSCYNFAKSIVCDTTRMEKREDKIGRILKLLVDIAGANSKFNLGFYKVIHTLAAATRGSKIDGQEGVIGRCGGTYCTKKKLFEAVNRRAEIFDTSAVKQTQGSSQQSRSFFVGAGDNVDICERSRIGTFCDEDSGRTNSKMWHSFVWLEWKPAFDAREYQTVDFRSKAMDIIKLDERFYGLQHELILTQGLVVLNSRGSQTRTKKYKSAPQLTEEKVENLASCLGLGVENGGDEDAEEDDEDENGGDDDDDDDDEDDDDDDDDVWAYGITYVLSRVSIRVATCVSPHVVTLVAPRVATREATRAATRVATRGGMGGIKTLFDSSED